MSVFDLNRFVPEYLQNIELYDPERKPVLYDLSDNTSQWGMSDAVKQSLFSGLSKDNNYLSRYPDIYASEVKEELGKYYSRYVGENGEQKIVVGCGTDDILDSIIRSLTRENDSIAICTPTFLMAKYFAQVNFRKVFESKLDADGNINFDELIASNAKLIYLCSPNNPTGLSIEKGLIEKLLDKFEGVVVIDEAYSDYSEQNCLDLLSRYENLIITRTFSKLYALAGLRIGYGLTNPDLAKAIEAVKGPYKINSLAQIAALAAIADTNFSNSVIAETLFERDSFIKRLDEIGYSPIDSDANFIFIPLEVTDEIVSAFKEANISVRIFKNLDIYNSGIRVTVSKSDVNNLVVDILEKVKNGK